MIGVVLQQEWLLGGRRARLHLLRWIYGAWLIVLLLYGYARHLHDEHQRLLARASGNSSTFLMRSSAPEMVGQWFAETFVTQQLLLLALMTPAFVGGAIAEEKRRGTLQYLLTADLEARHIVVGKLLARAAQVILVALAGLPLFALLAGFGGVQPIFVPILAVALLAPMFGLASMALLASVWCRQSRDAVLALYVVGALAGGAVWYLQGWLRYFDPLFVLAPAWSAWRGMDAAEVGRRLAISSACWGILGGVALGLAIARLRPAYRAELENARPKKLRWYTALRAPVGDEPILWRERHVEGLAPTPELRRVPQWLAVALISGHTTVSSLLILGFSLPAGVGLDEVFAALANAQAGRLAAVMPNASNGFLVQGMAVMLLGSLVAGIRCSGAITGERERGTWEALLLTPLSAKELIHGKWWGIMGSSYIYLLAYAVPALVLSVLGGVVALLWVLLCLAVAVLAMYYLGAAGLWASARSNNSWRALLTTLLAGYVGGLAIYLCSTPILALVSLILNAFVFAFDKYFGTQWSAATGSFSFDRRTFTLMTCLGLALLFWLMSRFFLNQAQHWVADRERTRHWFEEPVYRRSRRRPVEKAAR